MSHSNSSLNTFTDCQKRYEHSYILRTSPERPPSVHLLFGSMAHEVLLHAGELRDAAADGVVTQGEYNTIIPSEVLYTELKESFGIKSWQTYFKFVIDEVAKDERELIKEMVNLNDSIEIKRELKLSLTAEQLRKRGYTGDDSFTGIIDLLILGKNHAFILDYKFSTKKKTQSDFDLNSQLPMYALFVNELYGIPLRNIKIGYIDIPKNEFALPIVLTNGTLSRSKSQNVSQEIYKMCVEEIHGKDDPVYNVYEGGYYYDCYCALAFNKAAYMQTQWLDEEMYECVIQDILDTASTIDDMKRNHKKFLRKYDSYSCSNCDYLKHCKSWMSI